MSFTAELGRPISGNYKQLHGYLIRMTNGKCEGAMKRYYKMEMQLCGGGSDGDAH